MQIGYYGLGKMGFNMVLRLKEKGYQIIAGNRSEAPRLKAKEQGIKTEDNLSLLVKSLDAPRTIWVMVSHQALAEVFKELIPLLEEGDTVIDGGNSPYKESIKRARELEEKKINFLDVGVSGGPSGARNGACIMVGGKIEVYEKYKGLFSDLSAPEAFSLVGKSGAGHFAKMVHNGIEYGMMQSIGEGFNILKNSEFEFNLLNLAQIYSRQSVISSRLISWLCEAFLKEGEELKNISGSVKASGEGHWTVQAAKELGLEAHVLEASVLFRDQSEKNPSYIGKIVSALRGQFGGHDVKK